MLLIKKFSFDSAHNLADYGGKCEKLHGHTYRLVVKLEGRPAGAGAMVMDFAELKRIVQAQALDALDHSYLNDLVPQSTVENVVVWIWKRLAPALKRPNCRLTELELWETADSGVVYRGK